MRAELTQESEAERLAFAHSFLPGGWTVETPSDDSAVFGGSVDVWSIDRMTASHIHNLDCRLTRRGADGGAMGQFRLRLVVGGSVEGIVGGERHRMEEGDLSLEAPGVQMAVECRDMSALIIAVPAHDVGFDPNVHPRFALIPGDKVPGKMLGKIVRGYFDLLPEASLKEAEIAAAMWPGLVAGSLGRIGAMGLPRSDLHARNMIEMKRYIEDHLDDPDLGVATLVEKFPVSRAVAYRLFQRDGGVKKFIVERRMVNAAKMLAFSSETSSVAEVARRVGIANASHFARLFRERFGIAPSEVRSAYRSEAADGGEAGKGEDFAIRLRAVLHD